jgi:hypothetical protein
MKKKMMIVGGGVLIAALLFALTGCPTESTDESTDGDKKTVTPDFVIANADELSKIEAADASLGGTVEDPLYVKFAASFTDAEFAKLRKYDEDEALVDPLAGLFAAITTKYVYLDMRDSGWTGLDEVGSVMAYAVQGSGSAALNEWVDGDRGQNRHLITGMRMPKALQKLGGNMFRNMTGLKTLSFNGCGELDVIGTRAFQMCSNLTEVDFSGCTKLNHIDQYAFQNIPGIRTKGSTDAIDLSPLTALAKLNDYAFNGTTATKVILPKVDALFIGMYGLEAYGVRSMEFKGSTLVDFAWRAGLIYTDKTNNTVEILPLTHNHESTDGQIGPRTDRVPEVFFPESISFERQFNGYLHSGDDDGYNWAGMHIPLKNGQDVYRGQTNMNIQAAVSGAPSGSVSVYSRKDAQDQYKVGVMQDGKLTLNTPNASNVAALNQTSGMEITHDPRKYHTTQDGLQNNSTADFAVYDNAADQWTFDANYTTQAGAPPNLQRPSTGYWWQPWIGNNQGTYNTSVPAKFIQLKSLFYQNGSNWVEIKRVGEDTWVNRNHYYDDSYVVDRHEIAYVWVDQDVTISRIAKGSTDRSGDMGDAKNLGYSQNYWEIGSDKVYNAAWRGTPWGLVFHTVQISLKKGWNQIETLTRYADGSDAEWKTAKRIIRVSSGLMGPFSTYSAGNMTNFNTDTGKAYMTYYDRNEGDGTPSGPRQYSDEEHPIQVPWVAVP